MKIIPDDMVIYPDKLKSVLLYEASKLEEHIKLQQEILDHYNNLIEESLIYKSDSRTQEI